MTRRPTDILFLILLLTVITSGCTLHEHPHGQGSYPAKIKLNVRLTLNRELQGISSSTTDNSAPVMHRFIVEAISPEGTVAERIINYAPADGQQEIIRTIDMQLQARNYRLLAWCDYVLSDAYMPMFYDATSLRSITGIKGQASSELKDCFFAADNIDLSIYSNRQEANVYTELMLSRPVGRYEIISTDLGRFRNDVMQNYINGTVFTASIDYIGSSYSSFDVSADFLRRGMDNHSYQTIIDYSGNETRTHLGVDYLFASATDSPDVSARITISNEHGEIINTNDIVIPLRRNHNTIITGRFLSASIDNGVTIDSNYDGTIDIDLDK